MLSSNNQWVTLHTTYGQSSEDENKQKIENHKLTHQPKHCDAKQNENQSKQLRKTMQDISIKINIWVEYVLMGSVSWS